MNKWIEIAFAVVSAIMVTYATMTSQLQNNSYRIDRLEKTIEEHLQEHRVEYKEMQNILMDIRIKVSQPDKRG